MARTPQKIPAKASEAWERGDVPTAERLSGLKERRLRDRLGAPGKGPAMGSASAPALSPASPPPPRLVKLPPRGSAAAPSPPPSEPEPTVEQIGRIDTRDEAEALFRDIKGKLGAADDVRYASLAEKALAALNRIEQIDKRRPQPPGVDEVTARLVAVRDRAIERFGILAREAVAERFHGGAP